MNKEVTASEGTNYPCGCKQGSLPPCAPLATGYVPAQQSAEPRYPNNDALSRGTLFPGLDLPFMNRVNATNPYAGTPMGELMALEFIVKELNLYLDTHKNDTDAFELLKSMALLLNEAQSKFTRLYGPVKVTDLASADSYDWLASPWPWEYAERMAD